MGTFFDEVKWGKVGLSNALYVFPPPTFFFSPRIKKEDSRIGFETSFQHSWKVVVALRFEWPFRAFQFFFVPKFFSWGFRKKVRSHLEDFEKKWGFFSSKMTFDGFPKSISSKCRKKKRRKIVTKCIKRKTNLLTTSLSMMIWILSNVIIQSFINHYYYCDAAIWNRAITSSLFSSASIISLLCSKRIS